MKTPTKKELEMFSKIKFVEIDEDTWADELPQMLENLMNEKPKNMTRKDYDKLLEETLDLFIQMSKEADLYNEKRKELK